MSAFGGAGSISDILFEDDRLNKRFSKLRTEKRSIRPKSLRRAAS